MATAASPGAVEASTGPWSAYVDVPEFLAAASGLDTATLVGLNTALAGSETIAAGSLILPVESSGGWVPGPLWLLDGPASELVRVVSAPDGATLALAAPGTILPHAPGVSASQGGSGGSLAALLLRASGWMESYCQQGAAGNDRSLFAAPRAETWGMPGARAWLDRDGVVAIRAGHFPIISVDGVILEAAPAHGLTLDVSRARITSDRRIAEVPLLTSGGWGIPLALVSTRTAQARARRQWVTFSYTGGLVPGDVPQDVRQAGIWVGCELLAQRRNPTGAAAVRMGQYDLQQRPRFDPTGDSLLLMRAKAVLEPYRNEVY